MQLLTKPNSPLIQIRIPAAHPADIEVRFPVDAKPDFPRLDVRVQQIENHVAFENAVAAVRLEEVADLRKREDFRPTL